MSTWLSLASWSHDNLVSEEHGIGKLCAASNFFSARPEKETEVTSLPDASLTPNDSRLLVSLLYVVPAPLGKADWCYQHKIAEMWKCDF